MVKSPSKPANGTWSMRKTKVSCLNFDHVIYNYDYAITNHFGGHFMLNLKGFKMYYISEWSNT